MEGLGVSWTKCVNFLFYKKEKKKKKEKEVNARRGEKKVSSATVFYPQLHVSARDYI